LLLDEVGHFFSTFAGAQISEYEAPLVVVRGAVPMQEAVTE